MAKTSYAVALGSNRRSRHGSPEATLRAAADAIGAERLSAVRATPALGPAGRSFANAAAIVTTDLSPPELLSKLKGIERAFGRRRGRSWGARVLDLDILLWSEGCWKEGDLLIPHPHMRDRRFVLDPLAELAPDWRDPILGLSMRQLRWRLRAAKPIRRDASSG
ncbi:2-amino-4-hydroxy-6-hydroxymethyldihydropteridine diphosphokinase [Sphingosinicella rhizophila]|uniref:2-amino-4-hydroxy-6-hydroxymethyldihydropteridine pyrophosphokinase n=1 Tax=Sphingosinicella rhizophila TaxID=3050082 RepID=A0ABU3Q500_9SPHN|nr:2-amino-4-hydroxy-6-hydroxymethyldihydropteridine diphosphokinase [Sphingosinicella sp. GR2756]MDT9598493.1 2-amino-4-hydroxy-6-hydroxymethyldihydropteridine diphosphokinase [Sphingosinicella sp. GR2756]